MIRNILFVRQLMEEMREWIDLGIISPAQADRLRKRYQPEPSPEKVKSSAADAPPPKTIPAKPAAGPINIARVVIALATLCLAAGIVIFYASNWRWMPPALKLVQIIIVIMISYGCAWFFLQPQRKLPLVGAALLIVGIVSYGAGIMLVAQIYHISAHPAGGMFAWAAGALLISLIARQRAGLYLSLALFWIWNVWEISFYNNPAVLFVIPLALTALVSVRSRDALGIFLCALAAVWWIFQTAVYCTLHYGSGAWPDIFLMAAFLLTGVLLRAAASLMNRYEMERHTVTLLNAAGWCAVFLPAILYLNTPVQKDFFLLLWGGIVLISAVLRSERWGIFIAAALFSLWNIQQLVTDPRILLSFAAAGLIIAAVFHRRRDAEGLAAAAVMLTAFLFQSGWWIIISYVTKNIPGLFALAGWVAAGAFLRYAGGWLKSKDALYVHAGAVLYIGGWMLCILPLVQILYLGNPVGNEILCWAAAMLAGSIILRERIGYFASAEMFFIWSIYHLAYNGTVPWAYGIALAVTALVFIRSRDREGIVLSAASFIYFYCVIVLNGIVRMGAGENVSCALCAVSVIPLGSLMIITARIWEKNAYAGGLMDMLRAAGWCALLLPFAFLSWPFKVNALPALLDIPAAGQVGAAYLALISVSVLGTALLRYQRKSITLILPAVLYAILMGILPLHSTMVRMICMHAALVFFIGLLLYQSWRFEENHAYEKAAGFALAAGMVIIKGAGFISYAEVDTRFHFAYLIGFILFATVVFLINRLVAHFHHARGIAYPQRPLDCICAASVWLTVYMASFESQAQKSVFSADGVVIVMICMFTVLAVLLYTVLLKKLQKDRIPIYLSLVIFLVSGAVLFSAGPGISWPVYAAVFNILLLVISVTFIYYSSVIQSKKLLNIAVTLFILHVFTRYFDLFWDMFSGSILFMLTGLLGLTGGYLLERKRRGLSGQIDDARQTETGEKG